MRKTVLCLHITTVPDLWIDPTITSTVPEALPAYLKIILSAPDGVCHDVNPERWRSPDISRVEVTKC